MWLDEYSPRKELVALFGGKQSKKKILSAEPTGVGRFLFSKYFYF